MTKIYLVTSHQFDETGSLKEAFYTMAFTNKRKAEAYLKYVDLSEKIAGTELEVINKLQEIKLCNLDWTTDVEKLKESIKELPY